MRYVREVCTVPTPKPEQLRVLYLTANPEQNLRTDAEVRGVQDQVRRAPHRDLITIDYRPAASSDDLIAALNDLRPHVVHFSGHAGDAALLFDNGNVKAPVGAAPRELDATDVCRPGNVSHVEFTDSAPGKPTREHARSGWGEARLVLQPHFHIVRQPPSLLPRT